MAIAAILCGALVVLIVVWDVFETIVLPRTITRSLRLTRVFYLTMWRVATWIAGRGRRSRAHEGVLHAFGPLSLLLLLGLWAACLIAALALVQWGVSEYTLPAALRPALMTDIYVSASTFFTLGFGGAAERVMVSQYVADGEAALGLGLLALVIGYLPVIYQSFSRREAGISLLDARAGSPPSGGELLRRYAEAGQIEALSDYLGEWERWAADTLESHLSYPVLAFYRSQHDRESWMAALTAILDACALILVGFDTDLRWQSRLSWQAHLTYAMARHTAIDLALTLRITPLQPDPDRLPDPVFQTMVMELRKAGFPLRGDQTAQEKLAQTRAQYEPYVSAMADRLLLALPLWIPEDRHADNWQTSAWSAEDHFLVGG